VAYSDVMFVPTFVNISG